MTRGFPSGIPYIIGNEAAERFSFYGMKTILAVFMTKFLLDENLSEEILTVNDLSNNLINDFKKKKDLNQSKALFDKIGETILEKTIKEIDNFLNYENQ